MGTQKDDFLKWIENTAENEFNSAVVKSKDKMNDRQKSLIPLYNIYWQEQHNKTNKRLVWATWTLAIATIVMNAIFTGIVLYFQYFKR
jgi:hypothetical protein